MTRQAAKKHLWRKLFHMREETPDMSMGDPERNLLYYKYENNLCRH